MFDSTDHSKGNRTQLDLVQNPGHFLPTRRDGQIKTRLSWKEKLCILDPYSTPEATEARLIEFLKLFAFRVAKASITKVGKGPRAWTALIVPLTILHIARHLMADLVPTLPPQWVAARSFSTSIFLCIDVDSDRIAWSIVDGKSDLPRVQNSELNEVRNQPFTRPESTKASGYRVPYGVRIREVEAALRRLGLNPKSPRQVLIQSSPSGGRHYYIFFDAPYYLDQYRSLLEAAGLRHIPGQIEFFPSTSQGLRLPFGHLPGKPHDPTAWSQFMDDFKNGRVRRFSLQTLYENLAQNRSSTHAQDRSDRTSRPKNSDVVTQNPENHHPPLGTPKRLLSGPGSVSEPFGQLMSPSFIDIPAEQYSDIVRNGPRSQEESELLWRAGIQTLGTRTQVLNHLAARLIWFKHLSPDQAAKSLTQWAMNPRHQSRDIQTDLREGTD